MVGAREGRWRSLAEGWAWLALLRLGLALVLVAHALAFHPAPGTDPPTGLRPIALALAALPFLASAAQLLPWARTSRAVAVVGVAVDVAVVLGTLALFAFDPQRYLLALIVVVQAEAAAVLGLRLGVMAWAVTGTMYLVIEELAREAGVAVSAAETIQRLGIGLLLTLAGGFLSQELSSERRRQSDRAEAARLAQEIEARYRSLVERIPAITYVSSAGRDRPRLVFVSPQVEEVTGYPAADWTQDADLLRRSIHPEDIQRVMSERAMASGTHDPLDLEYRMVARDGRTVWVRDQATLVRDRRGRPRFWQGVLVDLTERKAAEEQVTYRAFHDELTDLPNRAMFEEVLDLALARARRSEAAVAVLFMDLDDFKTVNDTLGHAAGDEVLKEVGARLRDAIREADTVARRGGDEFLVLLPDLEVRPGASDPTAAAEVAAARIHRAFDAPFVVGDEAFDLAASIGISVLPGGAVDAADLIRQADLAMYRAKRGGRGRTELFVEEGSEEEPEAPPGAAGRAS